MKGRGTAEQLVVDGTLETGDGVHYFVEVFVSDRRALLDSAVQSAYFWEWLAATDFPCKPALP